MPELLQGPPPRTRWKSAQQFDCAADLDRNVRSAYAAMADSLQPPVRHDSDPLAEAVRAGPGATMTGICGVDEAGRGPLAGPVFAAAVIA